MKKFSVHLLFYLLCVLVGSALLRAQEPRGFSGKKFSLPLQDPKTSELKAIFTGSDMKQIAGSQALVSEFGMRTFRKGNTNDVELIAEAPQCLIDRTTATASSAGPIKAYTANTNIYIEGEGFYVQQTNAVLIISNKVQTVIRKEFLQSQSERKQTNSPAPFISGDTNQVLRIFSDHFEFLYESNLITYTGNVRAEDEQMELTCAVLNIQFSTNKTLQQIIADRNVVIVHKRDSSRATGTRATYTIDSEKEIIALTGKPFWSDGQQEGKADIFTFDRKLGIFRAENNAVFKVPRSKINGPEFLESGLTNVAIGKSVEISADTISFTMPETNRPVRQMIADKNVVITSEDDQSRATANKAVYNETTGVIELTGKPIWKIKESEIAAELLVVNKTNRFFGARTNVQMRIPSALFGKSFGSEKSATGQSNSPVEISSDNFSYVTNLAVFTGKVHAEAFDSVLSKAILDADHLAIGFGASNQVKTVNATGKVLLVQLPGKAAQTDVLKKSVACELLTLHRSPETGWLESILAKTNVVGYQIKALPNGDRWQKISADEMTIKFLPGTNQIGSVVADRNVFAEQIDFLADKEKLSQAHGDRAIYDSVTDNIEMTGQPTARIEGWYFSGANVFRWNFKTGKISATGPNKGTPINATNDLRILLQNLQP